MAGRTIAFNRHTLGFVPTMGALHQGHFRACEAKSKKKINRPWFLFSVNPTQFLINPKDLKNYPSTLEKDILKLEQSGVDFCLTSKRDGDLSGSIYL